MIKKKKNKDKIQRFWKNDYELWKNGRLLSLIILGVSILMFVLSVVNLPFLSAFPGYTFGFLFGYYSYVLYFILFYYSITKLFNLKIYLVKMISKIRIFYYSWWNLFILVVGIIILVETSFYLSNNHKIFPELKVWQINFNLWWSDFTSYNDALRPNINNSGIVINLIISCLYSIGGTIVSLIASFLLIGYFLFYLFFSSPIKKFNNKKNAHAAKVKNEIEHETKIIDLSFEDQNKIIVTDFGNKIAGEGPNFEFQNEPNILDVKNDNDNKLLMQKNQEKIDEKYNPSWSTNILNNKNANANEKPPINLEKNNILLEMKKKQEVILKEIDESVLMEKEETIPFVNPFDTGTQDLIYSTTRIEETKNRKKPLPINTDTAFVFNNTENKQENKNRQEDKKPSIYKETSEFILEHENKKNKKKKE